MTPLPQKALKQLVTQGLMRMPASFSGLSKESDILFSTVDGLDDPGRGMMSLSSTSCIAAAVRSVITCGPVTEREFENVKAAFFGLEADVSDVESLPPRLGGASWIVAHARGWPEILHKAVRDAKQGDRIVVPTPNIYFQALDMVAIAGKGDPRNGDPPNAGVIVILDPKRCADEDEVMDAQSAPRFGQWIIKIGGRDDRWEYFSNWYDGSVLSSTYQSGASRFDSKEDARKEARTIRDVFPSRDVRVLRLKQRRKS